jgi:uncharacterized protein (DUF1778 family)
MNTHFKIRLSAEQREILDQAAALVGTTLNDFIRAAIIPKAREDVQRAKSLGIPIPPLTSQRRRVEHEQPS